MLFQSRPVAAMAENKSLRAGSESVLRHTATLWILLLAVVLASCSEVDETDASLPKALSPVSAFETYSAYRSDELFWLSPQAALTYPYSLYADANGLTKHHQLVVQLSNAVGASSEHFTENNIESDKGRAALALELQRLSGFLLVMERFPHRFMLSSIQLEKIYAYLSQPDNLSALTKVNEQKLVRWFDLQLEVLRAGQTQKISMTRYEVEFSIHLLQKLLKKLSRPSSANLHAALLSSVQALLISLNEQVSSARNQHSLWTVPNGKEWFQSQVAFRTQTEQTLETFYNQGMRLKNIAAKDLLLDRTSLEHLLNNEVFEEIFGDQEISKHCPVKAEYTNAVLDIYSWVRSDCVKTALQIQEAATTPNDNALKQLVVGDNYFALLLEVVKSSKSSELRKLADLFIQTEIALATVELGIHRFKWSLDYAEQFLMQRSILSKALVAQKLEKIILEPGSVSIPIARYFELQALLNEQDKTLITEQSFRRLLHIPASQWKLFI